MRGGAANSNWGARVSKDEDGRFDAPSCFETPRIALECARVASSWLRCAAPQHEGRRDQPGDVGKRRRGVLPVSGLFFTESSATAARTSDTRIESRGRRCPRSPVLRVSPPSRRPNIYDRKQQPAGVQNGGRPRSIVSDCFYQWKKQLERVRRYAASAFAELCAKLNTLPRARRGCGCRRRRRTRSASPGSSWPTCAASPPPRCGRAP
jgi:hypothetical protein